ncbi:MAG: hypothetical protein STSR0004_13810 [Peptococcaceae bacterium]
MSKNEQKTPEELTSKGLTEGENEQVNLELDERRFLRRVQWRSTWRMVLIALGVVMVSSALLFVWTRYLLNEQGDRIDNFYPDLVRFSTPNTIAIRGPWQDVGWLGQQREYLLVRVEKHWKDRRVKTRMFLCTLAQTATNKIKDTLKQEGWLDEEKGNTFTHF